MKLTSDIDREEAILAQAKEDLDYWSQGDTERYGKSAAEDITFFNNSPANARIDGIVEFRKLLTSLKGQIPPHKYKIIDPKIQVYGNIGIFTLVYHALMDSGEILARARGTVVYHLVYENWVMIHTHWSNMEDA